MRIPYPLLREWAITPAGRDLVLGVWETAHTTARAERLLAAIEERDGKPLENQRDQELKIDRGVALIPVSGPLFRKAELFADLSGATSYERLTKQLAEARLAFEAGAVKAAILVFESPGGEAVGMIPCAKAVRALAADMPVEAFVESQASSAAWALASQCSHIVAVEDASVGSIGVRRMLTDTAKADEQRGIKNHEIISEGSPGKRGTPVDEDVIARAQRSCDDLNELFVATVAEGRGVTPAVVLADYGQGDEMIAGRALVVGMIDEIGNLESMIERLGDDNASSDSPSVSDHPSSTGAHSMATAKKSDATEEPEKKAEGDEPEKKDGAAEMVKCAECEGSGEKDGKECSKCEGEGEVPKDKAKKAEADDGDGDKDDYQGRKALAAMSGLPVTSSLAAHAAAIDVKTVPHGEMSKLRKSVAVIEAERAEEKSKVKHEKCAALVERAEALGYTDGLDKESAKGKRQKLMALAETSFTVAEDFVNDMAGSKVVGRRVTSGGHPVGKGPGPRVNVEGGPETEDLGGGVVVSYAGTRELTPAAEAYAKQHNVPFAQALVAVVKENPALYRR